jgi:hypothetical protein
MGEVVMVVEEKGGTEVGGTVEAAEGREEKEADEDCQDNRRWKEPCHRTNHRSWST